MSGSRRRADVGQGLGGRNLATKSTWGCTGEEKKILKNIDFENSPKMKMPGGQSWPILGKLRAAKVGKKRG